MVLQLFHQDRRKIVDNRTKTAEKDNLQNLKSAQSTKTADIEEACIDTPINPN